MVAGRQKNAPTPGWKRGSPPLDPILSDVEMGLVGRPGPELSDLDPLGLDFFAEFLPERAREFFMGNLLVRIHFIIVVTRWTGLAP